MRTITDKKHYTKPERIFAEILKRERIPFRAKVKVSGREVDFLIGKIVIEIGNHLQDITKNREIIGSGYSVLFITNEDLYRHPSKVRDHLLQHWVKK